MAFAGGFKDLRCITGSVSGAKRFQSVFGGLRDSLVRYRRFVAVSGVFGVSSGSFREFSASFRCATPLRIAGALHEGVEEGSETF